ncbi:restriction endonuclease subunit S [Helicobacter baculiformis]|uniref:Restriction endonuclease subunit S n=1 Tax=Helicobacter baculiformis TaxID=427351 RepID=A0ABV7ZLZ9_9HELI|nr:restriction endonuclease subunit S [Helicobacter baculiformis]
MPLAQNYPHLEISVLKLSEVWRDNPTKRMDAEYFKGEWVENEEKHYDFVTLGSLCIIRSGITPKDRDNDLKTGVVLLKTTNIRNSILSNTDDYFFIDENTNRQMGRTQICDEDVLINIVGATIDVIGRVAYVPIGFRKSNITQAMAFCRVTHKEILPAYLFVVLQTDNALSQIGRIARPTGQYNLNLEEVRRLKIPLLPLDFQEHIAQLVKNAHACLEQSKALYKEAQGLLEQELGTLPKAPPKEHQIKSLKESFLSTGRLDAEFYQSKYEHLETCLREYVNGVVPLKDLVHEYSSGFAFKSVDYLDQQQSNALMLIRINNIKRNTLDTQNVIYLPAQAKELSPKDKLQKGDLLISMSGSIGLACVVHTEIEAMLNQRILKIRVKNFIPEVLALYLNSVMGRLQFERIGTGGVQTNLSYADMQNIFVPKIPLNVQEQIATLLQESLKHRQEAKSLLVQARAEVEGALSREREIAKT